MSDLELQIELAKMLPDRVIEIIHGEPAWCSTLARVRDTEWLHVCWLIEQNITGEQSLEFEKHLNKFTGYMRHITSFPMLNASWQQRAAALIAVTVGKK